MLFWLVLRIKQEILKHVKTVLTSLVLKDITVLSHMSILHYRRKNALTRTQKHCLLRGPTFIIHYNKRTHFHCVPRTLAPVVSSCSLRAGFSKHLTLG